MASSFPSTWFAILHISEVPKNKPLAITRLNKELVVWQNTEGKIIIMDDKCPHRSAKLSLGKICNDNIICPFHGFEFASSGNCTYAPEFDKPINGLIVRQYPSKVVADFIWVNLFTDDVLEPKLNSIIEIHNEFKYSYMTDSWNSHVTRIIENQLDYTHLPVVHHNTIGRNFNIPQNPRFSRDEYGVITYNTDDTKDDTIATEYLLPNSWILHISAQLKLVVYFVPINDTQTLIYIFSYRKFLTNRLIKPLIDVLMNLSNKIVLRQDKKVVLSQGLAPSYLATNELLMKHDTAIRYFRELWQKNIKPN